MKCRFCGSPVTTTFVDLGMQPLSNAYLAADAGDRAEAFYPLHVRACGDCFLVQLPEFEKPERIFSDYAYLSSMSESWLEHCRRYAATAMDRFGLGPDSLVIEVASNDGYLLQFFKQRGVRVLGIEPAANVAAIAEAQGVPSIARFFGTTLARELDERGMRADLLVGNNVLAHVPDLNDFVAGLALLLAPRGVLTLEFPHLGKLVDQNQFDTIYHEHFSYFSFTTAEKVLLAQGLAVFDIDELPTHGGSLRVYAMRAEQAPGASERVSRLRASEVAQGLHSLATYASFDARVRETKRKLLEYLIARRREGKHIVGYGAAAKGNTLLNYCGIRHDFLDYVVDRSSLKQGKLLPGTHLPVFPVERLAETRPHVVLILPWNIREEIAHQIAYTRDWGCELVVPIPEVTVLP